MVNLNRQIGVSQARQGGFSAHVLPSPVGYQPPPSAIFYTDGTSYLSANPGWLVSSAGTAGAMTYQQSGGPFDEPYVAAAITSGDNPDPTNSTAGRIGPAVEPFNLGTGDYTIETWYRARHDLSGFSLPRIWLAGGVTPQRVSYGNLSNPVASNRFSYDNFNTTPNGNVTSSLVRNEWRFFTVARKGGVLRGWDQGVRMDSVHNAANDTDMLTDPHLDEVSNFTLSWGATHDIGQTRITIGDARYDPAQATIAIPTAPFIAV